MKTVTVIPTYNEAGNIRELIRALLAQGPDGEILVVDDHSPDGTWEIVREEEQTNPRVHLLHRVSSRGRGSAGVDGFRRALELGADRIIEMDGDCSHDPVHLPALVAASGDADVVIGSRYVSGGSDPERNPARRIVSALARRYLRWLLRLPVHDPTSGYRCFRREALTALLRKPLRAQGPFIIAETLYRTHRMGLRIVEVPITFRERRTGRTKLGTGTLIRYLFQAARLRVGG